MLKPAWKNDKNCEKAKPKILKVLKLSFKGPATNNLKVFYKFIF